MSEPVRLAKRLAEILPCSRREAEIYIEGGWVSVDGEVVEEPQYKVITHNIVLHPEATLLPAEPATLLWHQLANANADADVMVPEPATRAADDASGVHLLKRHFVRLTPTLPLEENASGLRVFTQNWRIARKLIDDAATVEQEYIVEVAGALSATGLARLNHGLDYQGFALAPAKVSWQNETRLRFALKGVKAGQIAHMCSSVGVQIVAMKRIRIGKIAMGKLPAGQWRYLAMNERF